MEKTTMIPEQCKKAMMIKTHLNKSYQDMKRRILQEILIIANMQEHNRRIEELANNPEEFGKVFGGKESNEGWDRFYNELCRNVRTCSCILSQLKFFSKELDFVVLLCPVKDESYRLIRDFQNFTLETFESYDNAKDGFCEEYFLKPFSRTLWTLFTHWDHTVGQLDYDPFQRLIDDL
jgi:hypothetical protein